jgi:4-amino-4-deoxy-L-arabinose transferase-like glycosyltransferase
MVETGDWVTPRLYGKPWFEKPPLYYWGAALSFKLFGVSEAAARLPSAVSALLATLAFAWLALRLYGAETARWLLLLLPTTVGMIGFSHAAATDMPFSAMLTIAMAAAAVVVRLDREAGGGVVGDAAAGGASPSPTRAWLALVFFGFFLGLAVLAKGPAAIILCGGAVFFWALFTKRWRDAFRLLHPAAVTAFCATALPWYILCARRNPDFLRVFLIEHNFKRYLTPEFQHIQPFWFYGPILFIGLFPWIGMVLSGVINAFRRKLGMQLDAVTIFVLTWAAFPTLFFSISQSKLPGYVLPVIPALVLLASQALAAGLRMERVPIPLGFAVFALTPIAAIAALGLSVYFTRIASPLRSYALATGALSFLAFIAVVVFAVCKRHKATVVSGIAAWLCFMILMYRGALPRLDARFSPRPIARHILNRPQIMREVASMHLERGRQYALNFYFHRELKEWNGSEISEQYVISSLTGITELTKRRIPYQLLDDTCPDAILIRIGQSTSGLREETHLQSFEQLSSGEGQTVSAGSSPRSGQPQ